MWSGLRRKLTLQAIEKLKEMNSNQAVAKTCDSKMPYAIFDPNKEVSVLKVEYLRLVSRDLQLKQIEKIISNGTEGIWF